MLSSKTLAAFGEEFTKIAALSPEEQKAYIAAVRLHNDFDRRAAAGQLDDLGQAQMRHNVERLKHFHAKRSDDKVKLPPWVLDPKGKPPVSRPRPHYAARPVDNRGFRTVAGGVAGGVAGTIAGDMLREHLSYDDEGRPAEGFRGFVANAAPLVGTVGGAALGAAIGHRMG